MKKLVIFITLMIPILAEANLLVNPGFDETPWDTGWTKNIYEAIFCQAYVTPDSICCSSPLSCVVHAGCGGDRGSYAHVFQEVKETVNCTCKVYYRYRISVNSSSGAEIGGVAGVSIGVKIDGTWEIGWGRKLEVVENTAEEEVLTWTKWEKVYDVGNKVSGIMFSSSAGGDIQSGGAASLWIDDVYISGEVGVEEDKNANCKEQTAKLEIQPNPFIQKTVISYQVPEVRGQKLEVRIEIYDVAGRVVKTLVNGEKEAGSYNVRFDAKGLTGGIYFAKLVTNDYKETRKLTIIK